MKVVKLYMQPLKCQFAQATIKHLGHILGRGQRPERIKGPSHKIVSYSFNEKTDKIIFGTCGILLKIYSRVFRNFRTIDISVK